MLFAAMHESVPGPDPPFAAVQRDARNGSKADAQERRPGRLSSVGNASVGRRQLQISKARLIAIGSDFLAMLR
jgi:hypothetical protein